MNTTLTRTQFDLAAPARTRRGWAYAGLLGGIGSFLFFLGPATMISPSTDSYIDNAKVLEELDGKQGWVWAFQTLGVTLAILIVIFALGLRRRLAGQEPAGSLVPDLAGMGLILMAIMTLVGTGISTEMFHALRHTDEVDPDTVAGHLAIYNTMAWVWAGGILTTGGVILNQRAGTGVPNTMNGPSGSGIAGAGAYSRRVGPGDIIIIPNKVAHGWSGVTDHVEYLSYRPDPDRVLPAPGVGRGGAPAAAPATPR